MRPTLVLLALAPFAVLAQPKVTVPYVGCKSDGQLGPQPAPTGHPKEVHLPPAVAARLAWYEAAYGVAILGPRGWYCFGNYGSAGATLFVAPQPIGSKVDYAGSLIELISRSAETSGRFSVAAAIARVFPAHLDFVERVKEEGLPTDFGSGPYPKDKLTHKSKEMVEYETPAETDGLAKDAGFVKNGDPIQGVAILLPPALDLALLAVRLPADLRDLAPAIVHQLEEGR